MSPAGLSWLQGCLFFVLGFATNNGVKWSRKWYQDRRTNHGTSHVELSSIRVDNANATTPSDDAQSSGSDEEARSPSILSNPAGEAVNSTRVDNANATTPSDDAQSSGSDEEARSPSILSNPVGEAMASTESLRCPDRDRLLSESLRRPSSLLEPSAETRKTNHFFEFVIKTEVPDFAKRETAYSTTVTDRTPAGLLRPSGGEDEALSPPDPVGEAVALPGTLSCPDRERERSNSLRRRNPPEKRTKSHSEKDMAKDESRNAGRPEPVNVIVAYSSSPSMASRIAVQSRPRRRQPGRQSVPKPSRKTPSMDHLKTSTLDGLHRRPRIPQGPPGEVKNYRGIRYRPDVRNWVAEMRPQNSKHMFIFGDFESELQAAFAIDAAFFYYKEPHLTNSLLRTPAMKAMLPLMPAGLNDKDKFLWVKDKAKRLAKYAADNLERVNPSLDKSTQ